MNALNELLRRDAAWRRRGCLLGWFAIILMATGGAMAQTAPGTNAAPVVTNPSSNAVPAKPATLIGYVSDDKYILRVGDKISLQIVEDKDAPKSLAVMDSGELNAPYVGRIAAVGKTCKQVALELKAQLEKEYYHRATVIIALDEANKYLGRVYVWGQVRNQGPMDLAVGEKLTVAKAILRAGGFADFANKKKVKLVRPAGPDGTGALNVELDMVQILDQGQNQKDVVLKPEDLIAVPARLINF